jgi:hypothetical protein
MSLHGNLHGLCGADIVLEEGWHPGKQGGGGVPFSGYLNSTFCLAPSGTGWGVRLFIALFHGCIPVIVQVKKKTKMHRNVLKTSKACKTTCKKH